MIVQDHADLDFATGRYENPKDRRRHPIEAKVARGNSGNYEDLSSLTEAH